MIFRDELDMKGYLMSFIKLKDMNKINKFCDYDLEGSECLVELKCRKKDYDEVLIEVDKYNRIMEIANKRKMAFYYVVSSPNHMFYFDMKSIPAEELQIKKLRCPKTTEFNNREYIEKECYLIPKKYKWRIV